jgi:hypothetical protein
MVGLPLLKLGGLAIKTLAKPVAKRMKVEATERPGLKKFYVTVGQWTHQASAWITISSAGHKSLGVKELEEAAAFARGADFLSEALVFFVGGAILTFEYTRSNMSAAQKEAAKEAGRQKFREDLEARFLVLEARVDAMEEQQQAGWARLFPGGGGGGKGGREAGRVALEDLPPAPHFADVETLKQKKKKQAADAAAAAAAAVAAAAAAVEGKEKEKGEKGGGGQNASSFSSSSFPFSSSPTPQASSTTSNSNQGVPAPSSGEVMVDMPREDEAEEEEEGREEGMEGGRKARSWWWTRVWQSVREGKIREEGTTVPQAALTPSAGAAAAGGGELAVTSNSSSSSGSTAKKLAVSMVKVKVLKLTPLGVDKEFLFLYFPMIFQPAAPRVRRGKGKEGGRKGEGEEEEEEEEEEEKHWWRHLIV